MTAPACGTCGSAVSDAFICAECTKALDAELALAASIAPALEEAVARLRSREPGRGNGEVPLPFDLRASAARDQLLAAVAMWAHIITGRKTATISGASISLHAHLGKVRQHPRAAEAHAEITAAVAWAMAAVDRPPDRIYAGPCPRCGADLLGEPGAQAIQCPCGEVSEVAERTDAMREVMRDLLGSAQWCVTAASALGVRVTDRAVYMWAERKQLIRHGSRPSLKGEGDVPLYRLGDVLKLAEEGPRGNKKRDVA